MKVFKAKHGTIFLGDCLKAMQQLPDNSVTLAFTSPPYLNAINYEEHIEKLQGKKERWERKEVSYNEYRDFLIERFKELIRVIKPGGYNIVNISPVGWNGNRVALPFHFVSWMESIGWKFREDIIWEKPVAKDRRSGVLLQHPYPGYYYPSLVSEYVFVFQKPAEKENQENIYWFRTPEEKERNKIDLKNYQGEMSKNVWKIRQVAPQENIHPCAFPTELAARVVNFYSYKNDIVMDIFAGSGQTLLAAQMLGRKFIGMDTQKEYVDYALNKIKNVEGQQKLCG
ncbi:site-specific DNA-methyltransferase [Candidatus Woesearchaeota archaeon]|nr:site-specific DNA-methyltransferase [Candidatus Woesearchaeota archaeon]